MVQSFLQNAKRFVLRFQTILVDAPLQIYYSAIVFAQQTSVIRQTFEQQVLHEVRMLSMKETDWDGCHSTLEDHSDYVSAVAFLLNGQLVASASDDKTLRLWEAEIGTCRSTLEGHSDYVSAVAFLLNGQLVASASDDKTLRLWEAEIGTCRSTLEGHSDYVSAMSFSPDRKILHTNVGNIPLSYSGLVPSLSWQINQYANILIQSQWILRNQQCLLWLPSEHRSTSTAVYLDVVCLGLLYSRVVLLKVL
jgi:WD40 repeat protein